MFTRRITLFRLLGFDIRIDASWLLLALLVTWSLARGLFPTYLEGLAPSTYWAMGVAGTLGLFASIILHELAHSIVARRYGIPMKGITLFIFGGVAEMEDQPPDARSELLMAIAGPIASGLIAVVSLFAFQIGVLAGAPVAVRGVAAYLAALNAMLALFNMVPAFPLDGGRVLRAVLWSWKDNLRWATRVSSVTGSVFGAFLLLIGALAFINGAFIAGLWWFMIGLFVRGASRVSYQQMLIRRAFEGEKVARFMKLDPVTVPRALSIREFVEDYVYRYHHKMFPVTDEDRLLGCVTTRDVKNLPREDWERQSIGTLVGTCTDENSIGPNEDAMKALTLMNRTGNSRLLVVDSGDLVGVIALKDLLRFLSLKIDLEADQLS